MENKLNDCIIQGMAMNNQVRFFAAFTKDIAEEARKIHKTSPICTAALGRLLTAGAMMGAMSKNDSDLVTLRIQGNGPAKGLTVTSDSKSNVKGIIYNPVVDLPPNLEGHLNVGDAIGDGMLLVIKDIGLKEPYVGQTMLVTSEIAEDLTYYFATSEQIPTSVGLGVLMNYDNTVDVAGGFIIQLMPFANDDCITAIENGLAQFTSVTDFLSKAVTDINTGKMAVPDDAEKAGKTAVPDIAENAEKTNAPADTDCSTSAFILTEMMKKILGSDVQVEAVRPTAYKCNCSRARVSKALISLGRKEIQSMIDDGKPIEMNCEFCNSHYEFSIDELKEFIK
ncbi:molecular chaperone Hsp33 [Eubacterium ruminantium]|nr:molecular chaperone Hsp33 [Eubacterium ruminantium]